LLVSFAEFFSTIFFALLTKVVGEGRAGRAVGDGMDGGSGGGVAARIGG